MNNFHILVTVLICLLVLLLGGFKILGWLLVVAISFVLLMALFASFYVQRKNKNDIEKLEESIKKKERLGYGDEELSTLKLQLKYLKHE